MAKQKLEAGQVITVGGNKFEVMHISAAEDENGKLKAFRYELWDQADAVALRKANAAEQQRRKQERRKQIEEEQQTNQEDSQSE